MNLSTSNTGYTSREYVSAKNGLISIIIVLVLVVALYVGLIGWKSNLNNKIAVATDDYTASYNGLKNGLNIEVTDLQNRIFMSKKLFKQDKLIWNVLENVEKSIVSNVYLTSYKSDKNKHTLDVVGVANNYNDLSRQILSFKSSEIFSTVNADNINIREDGKIAFSIKMEFK